MADGPHQAGHLRPDVRARRHPQLSQGWVALPQRRAGHTDFRAGGGACLFLGSQVELAGESNSIFAGRRERAVHLVKSLPPRQRQVLELIAAGLLNKQIAWKLGISEKTVKMHRALLMERLNLPTSADLIRLAVEAGL